MKRARRPMSRSSTCSRARRTRAATSRRTLREPRPAALPGGGDPRLRPGRRHVRGRHPGPFRGRGAVGRHRPAGPAARRRQCGLAAGRLRAVGRGSHVPAPALRRRRFRLAGDRAGSAEGRLPALPVLGARPGRRASRGRHRPVQDLRLTSGITPDRTTAVTTTTTAATTGQLAAARPARRSQPGYPAPCIADHLEILARAHAARPGPGSADRRVAGRDQPQLHLAGHAALAADRPQGLPASCGRRAPCRPRCPSRWSERASAC